MLVRDGYTVWRPGSTVAGYNANANAYGGVGYAAPPPSAYAGTGATPNPAYGNFPTRVLATGEVLCLVQVPPEYKTITKQVMRSPGRTVEVPYPAETTVVSRQVVDVPAHVEKRELPGETKIVKVKVCTPDQTTSSTIPAEYKTITKVKTVSPSKFEWKAVDCKADVVHNDYVAPHPPIIFHPRYHPPVKVVPHKKVYVAPAAPAVPPSHKGKVCHATCDDGTTTTYRPTSTAPAAPTSLYTQSSMTSTAPGVGGDRAVSNLQAALAAKGYYNGADNGLFTHDTMVAMVKYQHDNHLTEGRYTGETANALGITR